MNKKNPDEFQDFFYYFNNMKKKFFKTLAKINKAVLPSLTKNKVDLSKASKFQMALLGFKLWVTKNALD
ncbi:adenine phosphoribosyltransferase [unidentified eubacterium SCB49]|nr:adenine phosphoribosyltransferase [unidentified eubacterium SCB49]